MAKRNRPSDQQDLEQLASETPPGLVREFLDFLVYNKKWWMTPIVVVLLLFGLLIVLAGTGVAPFIYPFF